MALACSPRHSGARAPQHSASEAVVNPKLVRRVDDVGQNARKTFEAYDVNRKGLITRGAFRSALTHLVRTLVCWTYFWSRACQGAPLSADEVDALISKHGIRDEATADVLVDYNDVLRKVQAAAKYVHR